MLVDLSIRGGRPGLPLVPSTVVLLSPRTLMAQFMAERTDQPDLPIALAHAVMATGSLPHESWVFVHWALENQPPDTLAPDAVVQWLVFALVCHRTTHPLQTQALVRRHLPPEDWCAKHAQHTRGLVLSLCVPVCLSLSANPRTWSRP